jgi:hypothetical protein
MTFLMLAVTGCTHRMEMVNCKEMFAEFYVDPEIARQNVPPSFQVRIHPNGKATLLILVQDCEKVLLDHLLQVSPMKMAQVWIEVLGPEEVGEALPGTASSLPTSYWYALPHQMNSTLAHIAFWLVGIDTQLVKQIDLGGGLGGMRTGRVVENDSGSGYHWMETNQRWPMPNLVTGRRWFYREYGKFIKRRSEGLVICRSNFLGEGQIVLEAQPESAVGGLNFGTTLRGSTKSVEINCEVNIQVETR